FRRIGFDKADHLLLGLAIVSDQLAGLVRTCFPLARGPDHLAALLRLFAQGDEILHAGLRRAGRWRRRSTSEPSAGYRRGTGRWKRRGCADGRRRRCTVYRRKRRSIACRRRHLTIGYWRRKCALRKGMPRVNGHDG